MTTQTALSDLTPEQYTAATYLGGPLRIIAGAGTGKTGTITGRYCYLAEQGIDPDRILALTFSNRAAAEMRSRITLHLGSNGGALPVQTFHAFCRRLLTDWSPTGTIGRLILDSERHRFLAQAVSSLDPATRQFYRGARGEAALANDLQTFVDRAQDDLLTPEAISASAARHDRLTPRLAELVAAYQAYLGLLDQTGVLDFNALSTRVVGRLRTEPDLRAATRNRFAHIMVDEFQDTNLAQYELIRLLVPVGDHLCVVGDANQAIYGFRGGRPEYLERLEQDFPTLHTVRLTRNFRSCAGIIAAANTLAELLSPNGKALVPDRTDLAAVLSVTTCDDAAHEAEYLADHILLRLTDSLAPVSPEAIAVLFRSVTNQADPLIQALCRRRIPFHLREETPAIQTNLALCLAILRLGSDYPRWSDASTVAVFRGTDALAISRLERQYDRQARTNLVRYGDIPHEISEDDLPTALEIVSVIAWAHALRKPNHARTLYAILTATGMLTAAATPDAAALCRSLIATAQALDTEGASTADLIAALVQPVLLESDRSGSGAGVQILTIHAAKGLEWPIVFLAGASETLFPTRLRKDRELDSLALLRRAAHDESAQLEADAQADWLIEERRLAYVAVTRARDELHITRPALDSSGALDPSRFIAELGLGSLNVVAAAQPAGPLATRAQLQRTIRAARLAGERIPIARSSAGGALASIVINQWAGSGGVPGVTPIRIPGLPSPHTTGTHLGFSFSSLETYQECPRKYMYGTVLGLQREESGYSLALGNGVHHALEQLNNQWRESGEIPGPVQVDAALETHWRPEEFEFRQQSAQLLIRARAMINRYFAWERQNGTRRPIAVEQSIHEPRGAHQLRGKVDLI
ncbi:MAG TPA: ATP-dependent DNA helicase, partial [Thermomicrobiales bacterium]|nr:ATP-dependent DNA helicase [Thermomicrobiales bacterium]